MGGFFMLFRLILFRLGPIALLQFSNDKSKLKIAVGMLALCYALCMMIAGLKLFREKSWLILLYMPLAMFPHYICYIFAFWILTRCIWSVWSKRVWNRIYFLSVVCVLAGVLMEAYLNPMILQFFYKIFK